VHISSQFISMVKYATMRCVIYDVILSKIMTNEASELLLVP